MLGPAKSPDLHRPVVVSLEQLIPTNHFYRHLDSELDLSFVRDWVKDCYAANGRPSIDPVVFFKLQLVLFFEGLRSERQLMRLAADSLSIHWYVGYHLDESLPDHSSLTRIRQRLGLPIFRRFFDRVVELCDEAGLVWGKELYFDATKVRANASIDSVVPRLKEVIEDHLVDLFDDQPPADSNDDSEVLDEDGPPLLHDAVASVEVEQASARWDVLEACRLDPDRPASGSYERLSNRLISRTDPDAALMRAKLASPLQLGFHDHYVVDGGSARIILQALVTPADVMENQVMMDLLCRVLFRWQVHPKHACADTTYGTIENIVALEDAGIRAYVPLADPEGRTPYFTSARFTYDPDQDCFRCPADHLLHRAHISYTEEAVFYQGKAATCNACPLKAKCTGSDQGRMVRRSFYADSLNRVRGYHQTPAYKKAMRKRKVWVEPLFGEAKQWHGLERFRVRGLQRVNIEGLLVAAGQNLKRLLAARGWGRRHGPSGSLWASFRASYTLLSLV